MRRIGVFGGTFDPVHIAHLRSAVEMREYLDLDEVRMIPCHQPVHRAQPGVSAEHRVNMLELAVADTQALVVDRREIDRAGPSYMIETLHSLKHDFSGSQLVLSLGSDAFSGFTDWHGWEKILTLCDIIVLIRPASTFSDEALALIKEREVEMIDAHLKGGQILVHEPTLMDVSSTQIRRLINRGSEATYLIPPKVKAYIVDNKLYNHR